MYQVSEKSEVGCHFSCWTFMEWPSCQCIVTEMGLYSRTSALVYLGGDSCTSKSDTPSNLWSNKPYPVSGYIPIISFVSLSNGLCNNRLVDCCNWAAFLGMPKVRLSGTIPCIWWACSLLALPHSYFARLTVYMVWYVYRAFLYSEVGSAAKQESTSGSTVRYSCRQHIHHKNFKSTL